MTTHNVDHAPELENDQLEVKPYDQLSQRDRRSLVFHLLYIMEVFDYQTSMESIVDNLNRGFNLDIPLNCEEVSIAERVIEQREALDERYVPLLSNWRLERIGVCTKLILRYAMWELFSSEIDAKIIINEAIELAKAFAEKDAYKFINGILDQVAKQRAEASSAVSN